MTDWMTIRVVLQEGMGATLEQAPGRVLLVHADHAFSELADTIDTTFGRWDLTPLHEFEVEGRCLLPGGGGPEDVLDEAIEPEDSEEVTVGEVGLRLGARFAYIFDRESRWVHDCSVQGVDVDPFALAGEEPDEPIAILGWGLLPDQYGRMTEQDAGTSQAERDWEDERAGLAQWSETESGSWDIVEEAIEGIARPRPDDELAAAAQQARSHADGKQWPWSVLWAAAGLEPADLPDDEELWTELAAAVVTPREGVPLDADDEAAWTALEPADWAGAVIELVRGGVGQPVTPDVLLDLVVACPEVDNGELSTEDEEVLLAGFETVVTLWHALGVVDDDDRLTALGLWGLPEALQLAWAEP